MQTVKIGQWVTYLWMFLVSWIFPISKMQYAYERTMWKLKKMKRQQIAKKRKTKQVPSQDLGADGQLDWCRSPGGLTTEPIPFLFSQLSRPVSLNNLFSLVLSPYLFEYILSFFPNLSSHQPHTFFTPTSPENEKQVLWLWQKRWIHCEF